MNKIRPERIPQQPDSPIANKARRSGDKSWTAGFVISGAELKNLSNRPESRWVGQHAIFLKGLLYNMGAEPIRSRPSDERSRTRRRLHSHMNSHDLAKYIEATDGISKPWLLIQLRLAKLKERRSEISTEEFNLQIAELHTELMKLGQWWVGREKDVF